MVKCEVCGSELSMPFKCSYCGGTFCSYHRLPEAHNCKMLHLLKMQKTVYSAVVPLQPRRKNRILKTSKAEITHLLVAWLALTLCFSINAFRYGSILLFFTYLLVVGTGFVSHELAHKFTAQKYGYWSEFRLWPWGLAMALLSSVFTLGSFIFAAPGATYVVPRYNAYEWPEVSERKRTGVISLAGPLSNVIWAVVFFLLSRLSGLPSLIGTVGFQVNLWLAAFNMIPLGGLDGRKIMSWSITVWAVVAIPLWIAEITLMIF